jgi:hypothetical protein
MTSIIWESKLDEVFDCKVERIDERRGKLTVIDQFDRILLDTEVGLSYGAMFGPDVADVALWEDMVIKVIDG